MNKPALHLRTVLPQPFQAFCRRFIRVLVDWMNSVASLKVGYVVSQTFPDRDPLGPYVIEEIHGCTRTLSVMARA
jgi:hypothetical protein